MAQTLAACAFMVSVVSRDIAFGEMTLVRAINRVFPVLEVCPSLTVRISHRPEDRIPRNVLKKKSCASELLDKYELCSASIHSCDVYMYVHTHTHECVCTCMYAFRHALLNPCKLNIAHTCTWCVMRHRAHVVCYHLLMKSSFCSSSMKLACMHVHTAVCKRIMVRASTCKSTPVSCV
jgi:hypothetical protein